MTRYARPARLPRLSDLRPPGQIITADVEVRAELLATGARYAERAGVCPAGEPHAIRPGDRVADLPDGRTVHVGCAARAS